MLLLISGCGLPFAQSTPVVTETQSVATDSGLFKAMYAAPPSSMRAAFARDEAIARASAILSQADTASAVRAREVLLTLESDSGQIVTEGRHSWLVTYEGLEFKANTGCSCYQVAWPNTNVALDAASGQVWLVFGAPA